MSSFAFRGWFRTRHSIPDGRLRRVGFHTTDGITVAGWYGEPAGHARTRRVGVDAYDRRIAGFFKEHLSTMA